MCAVIVAFLVLLVRTEWGRYDPGDGDSLVAAALIAAVVPGWYAWLAAGAIWDASTPGQRTVGLLVLAPLSRRRLARIGRFLVHPVSVPIWLWLAVGAALATLPWLPLLFAAIAVTMLIVAAVSAGLVIRRPAARAIHDHVGGTVITRNPAHRNAAAQRMTTRNEGALS